MPAERDRLAEEPAALRRRRAFLELELRRRGVDEADFGTEAERDLLRLEGDDALLVAALRRRRTFRFPAVRERLDGDLGEAALRRRRRAFFELDLRLLLEGALGTEALRLRLREALLLRLRDALRLRLSEDVLLRLREADLERFGAFGVADLLLRRLADRLEDFLCARRLLDRLDRLREGFFALRETR